MNSFNKNIVYSIFTYLLLLIASVGVHYYFILSDTYFTEAWTDSFRQIAHYYPYIQRELMDGNIFWSWSNGLGGDMLGGMSYYYTTSPLFWLLMLLPPIENLTAIFEWRLIISIAKLFIAMVLMFHLLRYLRLQRTSSIFGSLIYGGAAFFAFYSFRYDFMIDGMIYLPLSIWALEWSFDKKKPFFLIAAVFITLCGNFYLAFINSVFLGMYAILKYFTLNEKFAVKSFVKHMLQFIGIYAIGFLLACFAFLPAAYSFFQVDRFYYEVTIPLLFSWDFYKTIFYELFFSTNLNFSFVVAFPIVVFLLIPLGVFFKESEGRKRFIFSLFISFLVLIPFVYSFFNGLSAIQYRWLYLFIFTVAIISAFTLDRLIKGEFSKRIISIGLFGSLMLLLLAFYYKNELIGVPNSENDKWTLITAVISLLILILIATIKKEVIKKMLVWLLLATTLLNTVYINTFMFEQFIESPEYLKERQDNVLQSYATDSQQQMIDEIQENDNQFYRILWDRLNEFNTPMLLNYKGFGVYSSLVAGNIHRFMKVDYNTLHQNSPSLYLNLDNRIYLETALANKYYIKPNDSSYVPFGYTYKYSRDTYDIYENDYALPIGFLYDKVFEKDDFNSLTYAERDQLLLKTAVVDDAEGLNIPKITEEQLTVQKKEINMEDLELSNATLVDNQFIHVPEAGTISFENPWKDDSGEVMVQLKISETSKREFKIGYDYKMYLDVGEGSFYNYPREQIAINIVNHNDHEQIKLWLGAGTYKISDIMLTFNSYDEYVKLAESKRAQSLENVTYTSRSVKGEINADTNGILFTSIPYSSGWKAKVDGENVETIEVNSSFVGIKVSEGTHQIELTYTTPYFVIGAIISITTLLILIIATIILKRKKKTDA